MSDCGKPIRFICITTEGCDKIFGVTCNGTGEPCDGTISRCSDVCNFECKNKKEYFKECEGTEGVKYPVDAVPNIKTIKTTPPKFTIMGGLFTGGKLTVTFQDHPHSGIGFDPYYDHPDRTGGGRNGYDCSDPKNSFWRRWKTANCFTRGRQIELFRGFEGDEIEDMTVTSWSITGTPKGPSSKCEVTMSAIDKISGLNFDKKFPSDTTATHNLKHEISSLALFVDGPPFPNYQSTYSNINGNPNIIAVKLNEEIILMQEVIIYNDATSRSGLTTRYEIVERAACGTSLPNNPHQPDDEMQVIVDFSNVNAGSAMLTIIRDFIGYPDPSQECNCGPGSGGQICLDDDSFVQNGSTDGCRKKITLGSKALIVKPTSLKNLFKKFFDEYLIFPYCSREDGCIKLGCLAPDCDLQSISGSCFRAEDTEVKEIDNSQYTGVIIYTTPRRPCDTVSKKNNLITKIYGGELLAQDKCSPYFTPDNIKEIYSDWSNGDSIHLADSTAGRWLYMSKKERKQAVIEIHNCQYKDVVDDLDYGQVYNIIDDCNVDPDDVFFISSIDESDAEYTKVTIESTGLSSSSVWLHCEVRNLQSGECVEIPPPSECNPQAPCVEIW